MLFTSLEYAGFLAVVVAVNWALPTRWRTAWLLAASWAFYASWDWRMLGLLILTTAVTWSTGRAIPAAPDPTKRLLVALAVLTSVGVLSAFKVVEAVRDAGAGDPTGWIIPVGLSFFTFQAISYVVDVFRGNAISRRSFVDVGAYVAFFPHLLAGPIVRADKLIGSFHRVPLRPVRHQWAEGAELILFGVFKKVVLADPAIGHIVVTAADRDSIGTVNAVVALVAGVAAAYFDITGYVDIARGSAKLLGIDMQRNSLSPLLRSTGYADFWRRWQLTVMMWFRDYVYLPLRGHGHSVGRETAALFGSFAVLGLWHGLSPGWALWGAASGIIIVVERTLQTRRAARRRAALLAARRRGKRPTRPPTRPRWVGLATTYLLVWLTLPLIAAENLADVADIYEIFLMPRSAPFDWDMLAYAAMAVGGLFALDGRERRREAAAGGPDPLTAPRVAAFAIAVAGVVVFSGAESQPFLYFQF